MSKLVQDVINKSYRNVFMKRFVCLIAFPFILLLSCRRQDFRLHDKVARVVDSLYTDLPHGMISLTYDDGPGPGTLALAKYLYSEHICATFFVVGNSDAGGGYMHYPLLDSLVYYGQRIGNHTFNHVDLRTLNCYDAQQQIEMNQSYIDPVIKNNLCYFTPPWFGWSYSLSGCMHLSSQLNNLRGPIGMTFDTHDYLYRESTHPEICANRFLNDASNRSKFDNGDGGVIKMHDFNSYVTTNFALEETKIIVDFLKSKGYSFVSPTLEFSPAKINFGNSSDFSEEEPWNKGIAYSRTMRLADVNGDGRADLMIRGAEGVYVAVSSGTGFSKKQLWTKEFSDKKGYKAAEYGTTICYGDVDGDKRADLIVRSKEGIRVAISAGHYFLSSECWTRDYSDTSREHWNKAAGYYGTIRTADVNGDGLSDIIGRGSSGIFVGLSTGKSFEPAQIWTKEFSDIDSSGWKELKYSSTVQLADVNGDGKADLVVRSLKGIRVSLSNGNQFLPSSLWTTSFSDATGCGNDASYYGCIRLGDVNGDNRADIIARGKDGIHVLLSNGNKFLEDIIWYRDDFTDKAGYKAACFSTTLQCGDINGDKRLDFIFRSQHGISGAVSP